MLLTGRARFLEDLRRPGLVHLGVVRSAHAAARVVRVDLTAAAATPGVLGLFRAQDLPEAAVPIPFSAGRPLRARGFGQPALAQGVVRYVGQPVVAVVADDPARLADALGAVVVRYEPLPAVSDPEEALGSRRRVHENWPDNVAFRVEGHVGEPDAGLTAADVVVAARIRHGRLAAMPLEPRGVLAEPEPDGPGLTLWSSTQSPYRVREAVARVLGLPAEAVRVRVPHVGGGFGPKGSVFPEEILAAALARRLQRPVRWVETRREHLAATGHDRAHIHEARLGLGRDGTIVALEDSFVADVGLYPAEDDGLAANTVNHLPGPYRVPHYRAVGRGIVTHKPPGEAYRGAGRPEAVLVMERLLDLGARRLGLDPADLRRRNLIRPDEMPYRPGLTYKDGAPIVYDPADFPAAFERLLAVLDYRGWRARQVAAGRGGRRLGLGLACYLQGSGLGPYEGATVRVDPSGRVYVLVGVSAQGQGHATTLAQICAAELSVPLEAVVVVGGDTALLPVGMGTGGSRVAANAGPAVARAARMVRDKARRLAGALLECDPSDVRLEGGRAFVVGAPGRGVPLGDLAAAAFRARVPRETDEPGLAGCAWFHPETVTWAFGAVGVVVEVDLETCTVQLRAAAAIHDAGRPLHPAIVEGQLHGGLVQGLGAGFLEEVVYDEAGQLLTGSLMDYALPRADDVPPLATAVLAYPSARNELGVKGVGESGAIAPAAAVANAVEDALADVGVVVQEVPVTPAKLFAWLRAAHRPP